VSVTIFGGRMKNFDELTSYIATEVIADRKRGVTDTLRKLDFKILCWVYNVSSHELYEEIQQKAFVEDLK
jgi:uncharacterized membrane protein YGL010W